MVKLEKNKIVIEITSADPAEEISRIQEALLTMLQSSDSQYFLKEQDKTVIGLLREMVLMPSQIKG